MKDKKKLIIATSIILGVLVITLGLTYAAFTYNKTGETSKLVLGDIWMKYTENNQLTLADAMPMNINNYTTYKVNPEMANQEIEYVSLDETNELTVCVSVFSNYLYGWFDPGSDAISYCQGTGTADGITFQDCLAYGIFQEEQLIYFEENNIIIEDENGNYIVNPEMASQEVIETKEVNTLTKCYWWYSGLEFDEGSTAESFCKGTGTAGGGLTIIEDLDNKIAEAEEYGEDFFKDWGGQGLLDMEIVIQKIENLPYFEFTISGKNTYPKKDIWYEIVLTYGDNHETRTTRIRDDLLRFSLAKVEGNSETFLLNNRSYIDLTNQRIYVETIPANTTTEINNKYRLYMWISEDTVIGNVNQDYTMEEWEDVFASIKVGVTGDFHEKIVETPGSCFTYVFAATPNPVMQEQDPTDETTELYKCIQYINNKGWKTWGGTIEDYCKGDAYIDNLPFQDGLNTYGLDEEDFSYFKENNIILTSNQIYLNGYDDRCGSDVILPRKVDGYDVIGVSASDCPGYYYVGMFNEQDVKSVIFQDNIIKINDGAFANSSFTSIKIPDSITTIERETFLESNLLSIEIPESVTTIEDFAFAGSALEYISFGKNSKLETIGRNAFFGTQLTSVEIPNNVTTIGDDAFSSNSLTSVVIPNSVTEIGDSAFSDNQLKTVTIGSGIQYLGKSAFYKTSESNPNLESITFTSKTCEEIKNIQGASDATTKYFPWLYYSSPYYQEGYKADIIGTDGVCSYTK